MNKCSYKVNMEEMFNKIDRKQWKIFMKQKKYLWMG